MTLDPSGEGGMRLVVTVESATMRWMNGHEVSLEETSESEKEPKIGLGLERKMGTMKRMRDKGREREKRRKRKEEEWKG